MKQATKVICAILLVISLAVFAVLFTGCDNQAAIVSHNLSKEADNFNITRRLLVMNTRDNSIIMQAVGKISITADTADNQLEIIAEVSPGVYEKNFVGLNPWIVYTVEQCDPAVVSRYGYELEWMPEHIIPIRITDND